MAVYPGLKEDVVIDRLRKAGERLKMVLEVEDKAARLEELEEKAAHVKQITT